jgi:peptide/nickel transport system substrate-binding protein
MSIRGFLHENTARCALIVAICLANPGHGTRAGPKTGVQNGANSDAYPEYLTVTGETGNRGGALVISERSEPKTLNPLVARDLVSREIVGLFTADLIHINRYTQHPEPALASSWKISEGGRRYTLHLRRGLRFSDGFPFDADDVVFTFRAYLDERVHASQRDLLIVGGKPISVQKIDAYTVAFSLPQPYALPERLFDSIVILPRHLLEPIFLEGKLSKSWNVATPPNHFAGLGAFQIQQYIPGQQISLRRNDFYWKKDVKANQLPYLDGLIVKFSSTAETEEMQFEAGETDVISRFDAQDFGTLEKNAKRGKFQVQDAGPGLEYSFLAFNLNDGKGGPHANLANKQKWFRQAAFRRAISAAIDRDAIVRLAYAGRAYPLLVPVSPGNKAWVNPAIPRPVRSVEQAKQILRESGFRLNSEGVLQDSEGKAVDFSIAYSSAKVQQERMAAIMQQDLKEIGIRVNPVAFDFGSLIDRVFRTSDYEAVIMTLADGDADPNSEMNVWPSSGTSHFWKFSSNDTPEAWQDEIDELMQRQMTTINYSERKRLFDRVQYLLWENQPVVFLVSPHILAGAALRVANFHPAVLSSYTLWNADQLFVEGQRSMRVH